MERRSTERLKMNLRLVQRPVSIYLLVFWYCLHLANCKPLAPQASCNPRDGLTGSANSVTIRIQHFKGASVNFQRDKPLLLTVVHHKISNDGQIYPLAKNLKAKFHGREVCFSALKETILDAKGAEETKLYSCEHVCLEVGHVRKLVTNSSSGGRLHPGTECCVWTLERYLQLAAIENGPRCLQCKGRECLNDKMTTRQCPPGDRCLAVTLENKNNTVGTNSSVVPIMLGCSTDNSLRGYSCNDGCREVKVAGSGTRKVCVHCCSGDECNKKQETFKNATETGAFGDKDTIEPRSGSFDVASNRKLLLLPLLLSVWFVRSMES